MEYDDYEDFDISKDPLPLWKRIAQSCIDGSSKKENTTKKKMEARERFFRLRQGATESVGDFYERFKSEAECLEQSEAWFVPASKFAPDDPEQLAQYLEQLESENDKELAMAFLLKLDKRRFKGLLDELENSLSQGRDEYPTTVVAAYTLAMHRKEGGVSVASSSVSLRAASVSSDVAFVSQGKGSNNTKSAKKGARASATQQSATVDVEAGAKKPNWTCFFCREPGHKRDDCPMLKKAAKVLKKMESGGEETAVYADESPVFLVTDAVLAASRAKFLGPNDVLCDNEASVSIFHNRSLLTNIRPAPQKVKVTGIGGSITSCQVGDFQDFGPVYYHPDSVANILSFYDLNARYKMTFDSDKNCFIANNGAMIFRSKNKLYVCTMKTPKSETALVQTVKDNLKGYSQREIAAMKKAGELYIIHGRPSSADFKWMLSSGAILNCPVTVNDFIRWETVFGKDVGALQGKTRRKTPPVVTVDPDETKATIPRVLEDVSVSIDIFFVLGIPFLLSVTSGICLVMVHYLSARTTSQLTNGIKMMLSAHSSRGYRVTHILCDGEGAVGPAVRKLSESQPELMVPVLNTAAHGEHVPTAERKAQQIKERVRAFWNTLPFKPCTIIVVYLVYYCVTTINWYPSRSSIYPNVSAKELFTGRKVDYSLDCKVQFGQYVHTHEDLEVTNTMKSRTVGAIALGPAGNIQGTYNFLSLKTWRVVKRRSWTTLPMPQEVIDMLNRKAEQEKIGLARTPTFKLGSRDLPDDDDVDEADSVEGEQEDDNEYVEDRVDDRAAEDQGDLVDVDFRQPADADPVVEVPREENDVVPVNEGIGGDPEVQHFQEENAAPEFQGGEQQADEVNIVEEALQEPIVDVNRELEELNNRHRYNLRPVRSSWRDKYAYAFTNLSVKKGVQSMGVPAITSIMKEMAQLHNKKVFHPVSHATLDRKQRGKVIRSHLFLKKKRDGTLKSRLVADGSMQERSASNDTSSPTVSTEALFLSLAVDAHERRHVATVDIEGAYLHADMTSSVIVELDPVISTILTEVDRGYKSFMTPEGKLFVQLDKALYGCVESAKLFYEHISKTLVDYGYVKNPYDTCVFNKYVYGVQSTVTVHVDDLKISCKDPRGVKDLISHLKSVYKKLNVHDGPQLDYLGMDLDYSSPGFVKVSMRSMVEEAIDLYAVSGSAKTPATNNLFRVSPDSTKLIDMEREKFHSMVQRLLYIAKRARPDILTAVSFLTTRVSCPTQEDNNKLMRVLRYLNGTKDLALHLSGSDGMVISAFIDSSFAVHLDGKGHSGSVITVGRGAVHCRSRKQKLVAKSSTEAELVGLAEELSQVIWTRNFLEAQGYKMGAAQVFQDNRSTIMLAEKGRSTSGRTRHVSIRYFFVKDRIESEEIKLGYLGTESMVADFFTKPLQGAQFQKLRDAVLGGDVDVIAGVCWASS